mmetsp:Transcript_60382/g.127949  ORF Transcript_60382/g.127949 Transcript_60382/m.127949 type:complete len:391 (-) Transcript_60382:371-1543(-)|eukprot:CAMPEP_0206444106 /NCGR_PEP_ID=MMETSP0324_2-20121206/14731_1 /ASSEMBLY_ACC=CAM_ASM_000836 /TAXON_ID=2866 /ORGANISM="Crypthecodinium cohnii, Strain Seligo" /LENGTH=390 /DNA_ID=CAMNT_0053912099 /DNA_START=64 /DNA_END=1236 /DNA_ORIENTATION=-
MDVDEAPKEKAPTPVTIVTGFLGSGKTTLLKHILGLDHGRKIAVIQNELAGEAGVEAPSASGVTGPNGEVFADWVELANGCVCCSVRDDLVSALEVLVQREGFDNILIETTGLADPGPLASIFWLDDALESGMQLDAIVTVVDSKYCMQHLNDEKKDKKEVNECARQVAFADRLIVNKIDMVTPEERDRLVQRIRGINPQAPLQLSEYSKVPLEAILGVGAFEMERAAALLEADANNAKADANGHGEEDGHGHGHGHSHEGHSHSGGDCNICNNEHSGLHPRHGDEVGTVTITLHGELDLQKVKAWLGTFLWEEQAKLGMEAYRYKGLLSMHDDEFQYVLQGVHDTFELEPGPTKKPSQGAVSKLVFIGKCLNKSFFEEQWRGLLWQAPQ